MLGKTERRLALVILFTALGPLFAAIWMSDTLFRHASTTWLNPDVLSRLDASIRLYKDHVRTIKERARAETEVVARDPELPVAVAGSKERLQTLLSRHVREGTARVSLSVVTQDNSVLARSEREGPIDSGKFRVFEVRRTLSDADDAPMLVAGYAVERSVEDELARAGEVRAAYHAMMGDKERLYASQLRAFGALLAFTVLVTVILGLVLARGVTRRINRLAGAIRKVTSGDLSVRVPVTGSDELTELADTFNRMLDEMKSSRLRIEYLRRFEAWQQMAQRLAHEIKNPLTPIQLAVQQCHRKYEGTDPDYRTLLDTSLEIVEEEVGTLRRLVGNFSRFARLPAAECKIDDALGFAHDCAERTRGGMPEEAGTDPYGQLLTTPVEWNIAEGHCPVALDRQLLRVALNNLVRNANEALDGKVDGRIIVSAQVINDDFLLTVEDSGPGIPPELEERVFEPYVTQKSYGTGLGLAITMKIVVEHRGTLLVGKSASLGGARFEIRLPVAAADRQQAA